MANGSILIPEKFKILKKTIRVVIDDCYCNEKKLWGEADFDKKKITLCHRTNSIKYPKGRVLKKSLKEKTFFHELVHHILGSIGDGELTYDEEFVDAFATRLWQYEKTKQ